VGAPLVRDAMLVARQTFADVKQEAAGG
jgi:hypothetical protein